MKLRLSSAIVGVATLATSAGLVLVGGVAAHAATTPPYELDPQAAGTIAFYNSSGVQITSGSIDDAPIAAYAVGSSTIRAGDARAQLLAAQPNPSAATSGYNVDFISAVTAYPPSTGPADITSQTNPVVTGSSGDLTLDDFIGEFPNSDPSGPGCAYSATPAGCTNTAYQNLYQFRLKTLNTDGNETATYDVADVLVSGTTWTQVYPAAKTATATTLIAAPSPGTVGQTETLTANETPAVAGSVQFMDGATTIGTPVAVDGSGKATTTTSSLTQGSHSLSAVFTPTDTTDNSGSTGTATLVMNPAATATKTSLVVTQDGFAGDDVSLSSTVVEGPVTPAPGTPVEAGTVSWFDEGSSTPLNPTPVTPDSSGVAAFDIPAGLASGAHSIVAQFTPTDVTQFESSSSAPQTFFLNTKAAGGTPCAQAGSVCSETQNIQTTVPVGTLVINTPYSATAPLILPAMALNPSGTEFTTSAPFLCIQVTDSTTGGTPWTAQALAQPLTDSSPPSPLPAGAVTSINPENVGLTGLTKPVAPADGAACPDTQSYTGGTGVSDNPAASGVSPTDTGTYGLGGPAAHTFATGGGGDGTATFDGSLTLNAPTSTASGLYQGTIVFTVAD